MNEQQKKKIYLMKDYKAFCEQFSECDQCTLENEIDCSSAFYIVKLEAEKAKVEKMKQALFKLSKSGDGTHKDKHASFYDCLPTLQLEFEERLNFARETLKEIEAQNA